MNTLSNQGPDETSARTLVSGGPSKLEEHQRTKNVVLLAGNRAFMRPIAVAVKSLLNNSHNMHFHFVIVSNDLTFNDPRPLPEAQRLLELVSAPHELTVSPLPIDWLEGLPLDVFPAEMFARLFVDRLVPHGTERVLYLDGDVLIRDSVKPLFEVELRGCTVAAVPAGHLPVTADTAFPTAAQKRLAEVVRAYGAPPAALHFNSGVMVIDVLKWRAKDVPRKVKLLARKGRFGDQAYLNAVLWDDWLPLDHTWNGKEPDGRIIHFAGRVKPWLPNYYDNEFASQYEDVARQTGWDLGRPIHVKARRWVRRAAKEIMPPAITKRWPSNTPSTGDRWQQSSHEEA